MSRAVRHYIKTQVVPRHRDIFRSGAIWGAVFVAAFVWRAGRWIWSDGLAFAEIYHAIIAYSSIVIGFSVAAMTLVIGMPAPPLAYLLARSPERGKVVVNPLVNNAFARLIFVYSWTAVVHWGMLVASIMLLVTDGGAHGTERGWPDLDAAPVAVYAGLVAYGLGQFLSSLLALSRFGEIYIAFLLRTRGGRLNRRDDL